MHCYKLFETNLDNFLFCSMAYFDYYPSSGFYHPAEVFLSRLDHIDHIDHCCIDLLSFTPFPSTEDLSHVMLYQD